MAPVTRATLQMQMPMLPFWLLLHLFLLCTCAHSHDPAPAHLLKSDLLAKKSTPAEYLEVSVPVPRDYQAPSCSLLLLQHDFGNTIGSPPVSVPYSPPSDCPPPWTSVALHLSVSCRGEQYDRIAAVWIDGVEILRTSTAEPTKAGVHWSVRKDVSRYASLLQRQNATLSMMLENLVNHDYTGIYHVNMSLDFYGGSRIGVSTEEEKATSMKSGLKAGFLVEGDADLVFVGDRNAETGREIRLLGAGEKKIGFLGKTSADLKPEILSAENEQGEEEAGFPQERGNMNRGTASELLYKEPADLIIPISADGDDGFWFRIQNESDVHSKEVKIPRNTCTAVLEICVSFHGNDEFWYSNPPDAYIELNKLETQRGNGAFRQVVARIDGIYAGSVIPFPVVFTGGINPLFWEPVVAIGAFNLPSYDLDLTPFLGRLLDGKRHSFSLAVTDSIPFWLVNANLHLWLDSGTSHVQAELVQHSAPTLSISRQSDFESADGKFTIEAERKAGFVGWVKSSAGNLTTRVLHEWKFKNKIKFKNNGTFKEAEQKIKATMDVRQIQGNLGLLLARSVYKSKYPIRIKISTLPVNGKTSLTTTNLSQTRYEKSSVTSNRKISFSTLSNSQHSNGWMEIRDHSVRSGEATTEQSYRYRDGEGCYARNVMGSNGKLLKDSSSEVCSVPL